MAAIVERALDLGARTVRAGYVEGVATAPAQQRRGIGTMVMRRIDLLLRETFELGALSTSRHVFYEQLGWQRWQGPTFVRHGERLVRTEHEDSGIMVLRYGSSAEVTLTQPIICDSRSGDDW
jgi:aminoglycoside 2'-N-acetyltransferase I